MKVWIAHDTGPAAMGTVPDGVELEVYEGGDEFPSDPDTVEFLVPPFLAKKAPRARLDRMPGLKVIQLLTAGSEAWIADLPAGVTLCNALGVHTAATSEWTLAAILASLRGFDHFARAQARRRWERGVYDSLEGKRVLVVGAGDIGAAIAAKLRAFDAEPTLVARRARPGVHPVSELPRLLPRADIVVLIVPLTPETTGMVDAKFLARMRDGALLVNAARGPVVDARALIAETGSGRLSAALDVTDPEPLPEDNPLWTMPNVLITPHIGGTVPGFSDKAYALVGRQLRRYVAGEQLDNTVRGAY